MNVVPSVGVEPTHLAFQTSTLPLSYEGVLREGIEPSIFPVSEECSAIELPQQNKNRKDTQPVRLYLWRLSNAKRLQLHCDFRLSLMRRKRKLTPPCYSLIFTKKVFGS